MIMRLVHLLIRIILLIWEIQVEVKRDIIQGNKPLKGGCNVHASFLKCDEHIVLPAHRSLIPHEKQNNTQYIFKTE